MRRLKAIVIFVFCCFIVSGCSNNKGDGNLNSGFGENTAHISHLTAHVKEIREESLIIDTLEDINSNQNSNNLDIPKASRIYVFIPFRDIREELLKEINVDEKLQITYSNIAITNGIYTLTIIDKSQIILQDT